MTLYSLMDGVAGRPGVGSSGTQPPAAPTPYTGPYVTGQPFKSTGTLWFTAYRIWVPPGGYTGPQKFCLRSANRDGTGGNTGTVIPGSVVTSGVLTAGQFNIVPVPSPLPLTQQWTYMPAAGFTSPGVGFPFTASQFGATNPYAAGIVNGPLTGFSDQGASLPDPFGCSSSGYQISGADPTTTFPALTNGGFNGWLDVVCSDVAPPGATYRMFPSLEGLGTGVALNYNPAQDITGYGLGNTYALSVPCRLLKLWFWSGAGAVILPSRCGVFDVLTTTEIAGTDNAAPAWLAEGGGPAAAAGGWAYVDYSTSGVILSASRNMIPTVWTAGGSLWRAYSIPFWGTGGLAGPAINIGAGGMSFGVMSAPSTASGVPLQGGFNGPSTPWAFPGNWDAPENDWTDMEVIPLSAPPGGGPQLVPDYDRSGWKRRRLVW